MKRLLLATAAVIALAVAAPIATAQYTTPPPATAPYTTPVPDDPLTPQDESLSAQQDTTATQSQSQLTTPGTPETQDPAMQAQSQTDMSSTAQAQTGVSAQAQTYDSQTQMGANAQTQTQAAGSTYDVHDQSAMGANLTTMASLEEVARDAGMGGLPMSAQEVCAPRDISLTTSGTRLNRDKQHQLINAADRASVCELQRVVVHSPNGRADQARQILIDHGVDANLIEVQDAESGGLEVDMTFAGVATSSEQYAQMFRTQQFASYQPGATAPSYQPGSSYAPSTAAPGTSGAPSSTAPGSGYAPSTSAPDMSQPAPDQNTAPMDDEMDDGMSPTSGEPAVTPDMLDI